MPPQQPSEHASASRRLIDWLSSRVLSADGLCLAALCLLSAALFAPHIAGLRTFIGDSDRLNTFLNVRRYTTESVAEYGRVTTWNDRMFLGYSTSGLHWMVPELDPFGYFGALLPAEWGFWYAGLVSCLMMCLAGAAFYVLARSVTPQPLAALAAAAMYVFSAFAIARLCLVDWAYALLIFMPLAVLVIRRTRRENLASSFGWLALLTAAMVFLTFLQEVAYVCLILSLFACYRSIKLRSWAPVGVCAAAMFLGILFATPRVYTVYESFQQLDRVGSFQTTHCAEILRCLNEGMFGWSFAEVRSLGNNLNPREGLQLYSSTFATLLVLAGAVRWRGRGRTLTGFVFLVVLWRIASLAGAGSWALAVVVAVAALGIVHFLARRRGGAETDANDSDADDSDASFHLAFVTAALAIILLDEVRWLIHKAFFEIDFTHSRITIAALVPLNLLVAEFLGELFGAASVDVDGDTPRRRFRFVALAVGIGVSVTAFVVATAPDLPDLLQIDGPTIDIGSSLKVLTREAVAVGTMCVVFAVLLVSIARHGRRAGVRYVLAASLAFLLIGNAFLGAYHLIAGAGTSTYPEAFAGYNYLAPPAETLQPPTREVKAAVRKRLEADQFRTVVIADPAEFPIFVEPHLAEFYGLRLTGGYSAGVPRRVSALPWPEGVRSLRALSFANKGAIDWGLLASLNAKYVVVLDRDMYFNVHDQNGRPAPGVDVDKLKVYRNPLTVAPRQFFVRSIGPAPASFRADVSAKTPDDLSTPPILSLTAMPDRAVMLRWKCAPLADATLEFERKAGAGKYYRVGAIPATAQGWLDTDLAADANYVYRIRLVRGDQASGYSNELTFQCAHGAEPGLELDDWRVERTSSSKALVSWTPRPGVAVHVETASGGGQMYKRVGVSTPGAGSVVVSGLGSEPYTFRIRKLTSETASAHSKPQWILPASDYISEGVREHANLLPLAPQKYSVVEGVSSSREFSTEGEIEAKYQGDRIDIHMTPASQSRFLVLNELYDKRWQAFGGDEQLPIHPTNTFMRGMIVPAGVDHVQLVYRPFLYTLPSLAIMLLVASLGGGVWYALRRWQNPRVFALPAPAMRVPESERKPELIAPRRARAA